MLLLKFWYLWTVARLGSFICLTHEVVFSEINNRCCHLFYVIYDGKLAVRLLARYAVGVRLPARQLSHFGYEFMRLESEDKKWNYLHLVGTHDVVAFSETWYTEARYTHVAFEITKVFSVYSPLVLETLQMQLHLIHYIIHTCTCIMHVHIPVIRAYANPLTLPLTPAI